jgi:hypothetical protein
MGWDIDQPWSPESNTATADVLAVVFQQLSVIDPQTLHFAVPAVCRSWRDVCQSHVLRVDIDLII